MSEEAIDYQALYEQVQKELERTKLAMLKLRNSRNLFADFNSSGVKAFITKYHVIITIAFYLLTLAILYSRVREAFSKKHKEGLNAKSQK